MLSIDKARGQEWKSEIVQNIEIGEHTTCEFHDADLHIREADKFSCD